MTLIPKITAKFLLCPGNMKFGKYGIAEKIYNVEIFNGNDLTTNILPLNL